MKAIGESDCGHGVYIVSKREVFVGEHPSHWFNKKPWSQLQRESIYLPAVESYAPLAKYIINSCDKMGCNSQVDRFKVVIPTLSGIDGAIKNP